MPSHPADQLLDERRAGPGLVAVTLRLACGCRIARTLPDDQVLDGAAGVRVAVGKFPCPAGHAVGHRPATPG